MLTFTRTSCWAFPRGLTHTVIGSPVVRGNRFAISNSSSASGWETCCTDFCLRAAPSAAADLGDQVDLALGFERGEVGVLEDLAVNRRRHPFLDLTAEAGEAAVELQDQPAEIVRLHFDLGQPAGEPAGR